MTSPSSGHKAYNLLQFGLLSVLAGLLVAGLVLPPAYLSAVVAKNAAASMENLPASLQIGAQSERSRVLMADGSTLVEFYAENRVYVPLAKISKVMQQAQVDIEDSRFYEHGALDLRGTMRAVVKSASGSTQGGSTLTQQYVKQVQLEAAVAAGDKNAAEAAVAQTLSRKVRELRYAVAVEKTYSKDQILERYLNIAYYGDGAYGVEAAARHYFQTTAAKLTLPQAAMLAGLVQNPAALNPMVNPQGALARRATVLNRMAELGTITKQQADEAKKVPFDKSKVVYAQSDCLASPFPSLCNYVKNVLLRGDFPELGKTEEARMNALKRGGLTITTLIDPKAQQAAEDSVGNLIAPTDPYISTMSMIQPKTGLIVALAQNRPKIGTGPGQSWYTYAAESKYGGAEGYQAGSTFKAFTMAAAFEKGISPNKRFNSPARMDFTGETFQSCKGPFPASKFPVKNSTQWNGEMNMSTAAEGSVNTYFVQLEKAVGICDTVKMAQRLGIKRADGLDMIKDKPHYDWIPSFTLGPVEVAPMSVAEAYATFANRGIHCDPIIIKSIATKAGKQLPVPSANCKQAIAPNVADTVNRVLTSVVEKGTGRRAQLDNGHQIAGKTGTTDSAEAVWFAGYTPELVGVSMIAADKLSAKYKGRENRSLTNQPTHGTKCDPACYLEGSGSGDSGQIWKDAMRVGLTNLPKTKFRSPDLESIKGKPLTIPPISGLGLRAAMDAVTAAGFDAQKAYTYDDSPEGSYLFANPSEGTYPADTTIYFYISKGPRPAQRDKPTTQPTAPTKPSATTKPTATTRPTSPKPKKPRNANPDGKKTP